MNVKNRPKPKLYRTDYGWMQFWRVSPMPKPYTDDVRRRWDAARTYARALNDRRHLELHVAAECRRIAARLARTYA